MNLTRILVGALVALAILPATALAQAPEPPGKGDNVADFIIMPPDGSPLPITPAVLGFSIADTSAYTTEQGEPTTCVQGNQTSVYGKTVWAGFQTNRYGRLDVTASGFDSVLRLVEVNQSNSALTDVACVDRLLGKIESFRRDGLPTVAKGQIYALQIGGYLDPNTGTIASGNLQVNVELLPPEVVVGDAGLSWVGTAQRKNVTVKAVRIDGPIGATITVGCIRKKCGKDQSFDVTPAKAQASKYRPLKANPLDAYRAEPQGLPKPIGIPRAKLHSAAANVFKKRKLPNGARLAVFIQKPDAIGELFFWDVKKGLAGTKVVRCVEPDAKSFGALNTCTGQ